RPRRQHGLRARPERAGRNHGAASHRLISRILRLDLFAPDRGDRVVGRDRGLAHADRDQRDLAWIAGDVSRRVDARQVRLTAGRVDLDLALPLELEAPLGDRAEMRVEAEQRDQRVAFHLLDVAALGVLDSNAADVAVAVDFAHLVGREDLDAALALELFRLVDRRLQRTEVVAPVHQRDRMLGRVLEPERPVERAVAAADDHASAVAEDVLLAHEVVEALPLPGIDVLDPELARLEGPMAGGDDQRPAQIRAALVGRDREELLAVLAQALEALDLLAEQHFGAVLEALLRAKLDERLAQDLRVACD